jgi:hypothetical protein
MKPNVFIACLRVAPLLHTSILSVQPSAVQTFNDDDDDDDDDDNNNNNNNNNNKPQGRPSWPVPIQNLAPETYESV